jgi:hypothetical protein
MSPRTLTARERQRLDALIDRPLRPFRADIARMPAGELDRLRHRLEARIVGAQYSRSAHGMARHLAAQELPLLERRLALVIAEQARPQLRQLRLVDQDASGIEPATPVTPLVDVDERQAA